jgi:deoxyadenosine/deoxycytidine kinase
MEGKTCNRIISIEGNIGSGKSTLLAQLKEEYKENADIIFLREPVDEWESIKDIDGTTMIQKFYADQEKYSFPFQMMAYISRLALLKEALTKNKNTIIITERSLFTDKHVFAKMLYDMKKIEDVNYQIYSRWFDTFANDFPLDHIVYVKTDANICHDRIAKRSRNGESNIPAEYLNECHNYHEQMIIQLEKNCEITTLNGNTDIYENPKTLIDWKRIINEIIADNINKCNRSVFEPLHTTS